VSKYNAGDNQEFEGLQEKLFDKGVCDELPDEGEDDGDDIEDDEDEEDPNGCRSDEHYRLITVSHLSANVAKLLGGKYNLPADFFNRHLPGTEAISGRLISRLPSSVQIDFDELYESDNLFSDIWQKSNIRDGHRFIGETMHKNFLFQDVGWDYFPVKQGDWEAGKEN